MNIKSKRLNLFEAFAGIGSQNLALKRIFKNSYFDVKLVGLSEWDPFALASYWDIHFNKEEKKEFSYEEIKNFVEENEFSMDSKNLSKKILLNKHINTFQKTLNLTKITKLVPNIKNLSGQDLINLEVDIFTYSFPCQDLSTAGKKLGFKKEDQTRSGLLWEVERILKEVSEEDSSKLPKFLLLENVSNLFGSTYLKDFLYWKDFLDSLGYTTFWGILNSKDFGIPQNRKRSFAMSILNYEGDRNPKDKLNEIINVSKKFNLKKFLEIDYNNKTLLEEALMHSPNDTNSRKAMWKNEKRLLEYYDNGEPNFVNSFTNTLTTKQDRWNNGGMLELPKWIQEKYGNELKPYKYRFLTARESLLLMGFKRNELKFLMNSKEYNKNKLVHQAGNSIVVDVLEAIFDIFIKNYLESLE